MWMFFFVFLSTNRCSYVGKAVLIWCRVSFLLVFVYSGMCVDVIVKNNIVLYHICRRESEGEGQGERERERERERETAGGDKIRLSNPDLLHC